MRKEMLSRFAPATEQPAQQYDMPVRQLTAEDQEDLVTEPEQDRPLVP